MEEGERRRKICEAGGEKGVFLPLFSAEERAPLELRAFVYLLLLAWCFLGVSIIADTFMSAIEAVTSKRRAIPLENGRTVFVKVWNDTVANLTLMALGSSAPEILLSVIELIGKDMYSGELGPSTIVGSAAFNLFMIIAICVYVIPDCESRTVERPTVFLVTASFSLWAYIWLVVILSMHTPDVVDPWEGILTFCYFPILVLVAYLADRGLLCSCCRPVPTEACADAWLVGELRSGGFGNFSSNDLSALKAAASEEVSVSRAARRMQLAGLRCRHTAWHPTKDLTVGVLSSVFSFSEAHSELCIEVEKLGTLATTARIGLEWATRDGSMEATKGHYYGARGVLEIPEGQIRGKIVVGRDELCLSIDPKTLLRTGIDESSAGDEKDGDDGTTRLPVEKYFWVELVRAVHLKPRISHSERQPSLGTGAALWKEMDNTSNKKVWVPQDLRRAMAKLVDRSDAMTGQLRVARTEVFHRPSTKEDTTVKITVQRFNGADGDIRCNFKTESDTAREGFDFFPQEGQLDFAEGVSERYVIVRIGQKSKWKSRDRFIFRIWDDEDDVEEDQAPIVYEPDSLSVVWILEGSEERSIVTHMVRAMDGFVNFEHIQEGNASWRDQILGAFRPSLEEDEDSDAEDEGEQPDQTGVAWMWLIHGISFPWKLLFGVFVPPPQYCGGWACFCAALAMIGGVTAVIGDLAALLGCCLNIPDSITAISIVALGTSLPDAFASKVAAIEDPTADAAIGNVTGSNSVNVFLGLGLPWMAASLYWEQVGPTDEWKRRYAKHVERLPNGGFVVEAGDLVFSVGVFSLCAVMCLGTICYRRVKYAAELGGPGGLKTNTAIFLVVLWLAYVGLASWKALTGTVDMATQVLAVLVLAGICFVVLVMSSLLTSAFHRRSAKKIQNQKELEDLARRVIQGHHLATVRGATLDQRRGTIGASHQLQRRSIAARLGGGGGGGGGGEVSSARFDRLEGKIDKLIREMTLSRVATEELLRERQAPPCSSISSSPATAATTSIPARRKVDFRSETAPSGTGSARPAGASAGAASVAAAGGAPGGVTAGAGAAGGAAGVSGGAASGATAPSAGEVTRQATSSASSTMTAKQAKMVVAHPSTTAMTPAASTGACAATSAGEERPKRWGTHSTSTVGMGRGARQATRAVAVAITAFPDIGSNEGGSEDGTQAVGSAGGGGSDFATTRSSGPASPTSAEGLGNAGSPTGQRVTKLKSKKMPIKSTDTRATGTASMAMPLKQTRRTGNAGALAADLGTASQAVLQTRTATTTNPTGSLRPPKLNNTNTSRKIVATGASGGGAGGMIPTESLINSKGPGPPSLEGSAGGGADGEGQSGCDMLEQNSGETLSVVQKVSSCLSRSAASSLLDDT